ncbi:MAG: hypothetical protein R3321_05660 [Nitrososphaeraceae archaeon]|nr:hypothetical protein [Nitrososphaeraceae archaeon]
MLSRSDLCKIYQIRDQYSGICTSQFLELKPVKDFISGYGDYAPAVRAVIRKL